ncbi:MAG: deoxyribodipyrimidine photo-lyase [Bdellovibrionaceae bacterium]|nr:deoxyribodipyrimidine photo-lyase [Bdellovibrionales bacterium]MCB9255085.1 deoxyribodipyrimidine photo-lyase [Pseudobdellovibrionaceae bacterium]
MKTHIHWFRNDLRLADNPALSEAARAGAKVVCVYILSPEAPWAMGGASKAWLHASLSALAKELSDRGVKLFCGIGDPVRLLQKISEKVKASAVYWNRSYEPYGIELGNKVKTTLRDKGIECHSFSGNLLLEPWQLKNGSGEPYRVFTPYWKAAKKIYVELEPPLRRPSLESYAGELPGFGAVEALKLLTGHPWEKKMLQYWEPGENGAKKRLTKLTESFLKAYPTQRDLPELEGTSCLSPHLHFGEISPKQILSAIGLKGAAESFIRQVAWREFGHSLLYYFPETTSEPLNPQFKNFSWKADSKALEKWKKGMTGYPIVDAGMRELWETGWMHNRVRMIAASFLVKDLLVHWREGAAWFWETLVDADLANNTLGWQWVAGCGADAAPFFRIFNPMLQGKKFDPDGNYVRTWLPELSKLPNKAIHEPWTLSAEELRACGVELGKTYPKPMLDHGMARDRALEHYQALKS